MGPEPALALRVLMAEERAAEYDVPLAISGNVAFSFPLPTLSIGL